MRRNARLGEGLQAVWAGSPAGDAAAGGMRCAPCAGWRRDRPVPVPDCARVPVPGLPRGQRGVREGQEAAGWSRLRWARRALGGLSLRPARSPRSRAGSGTLPGSAFASRRARPGSRGWQERSGWARCPARQCEHRVPCSQLGPSSCQVGVWHSCGIAGLDWCSERSSLFGGTGKVFQFLLIRSRYCFQHQFKEFNERDRLLHLSTALSPSLAFILPQEPSGATEFPSTLGSEVCVGTTNFM